MNQVNCMELQGVGPTSNDGVRNGSSAGEHLRM